jgi:hypothetical protein
MAFVCDVDAVTVSAVALPAADVLLSVLPPESISFHGSVFKVSHIVFLCECEQSPAVGLVVDEVSEVGGAGGEAHESLPHLAVEAEAALVERKLGDHHAQPVPTAVVHAAEVEGVLAPDHLIALLLGELRHGEVVLTELVRGRLHVTGGVDGG